jgi:hypothetical protein
LAASGCGQPPQITATPPNTPAAVPATIVAQSTNTPASLIAPSPMPSAPSLAPAATGTALDQCKVVAVTLNLRGGPGADYPTRRELPSGASLAPLSRSPDMAWIEVRLVGEQASGWVRAGDALITCAPTLAQLIARLPQGVVPPLPTAVLPLPAEAPAPPAPQPPMPPPAPPTATEPPDVQPPQPPAAQPPLPPPVVPIPPPPLDIAPATEPPGEQPSPVRELLPTETPFRPPERARPTPARP